MKYIFYTTLFLCIFACSPYKKITLTMSDRLTNRWKGATETAVVSAVGTYKERVEQTDGYALHFDYSYALVGKEAASSRGFQVRAGASNQPNSITPRVRDFPSDQRRSSVDSVIKSMDFYFDKSRHVQSVYAAGYPDSVYYAKRR